MQANSIFEGKMYEAQRSETTNSLPVFFPPPVVSYLHYANQLAIQLTRPNLHSRFFVHYLQLYWNKPAKLEPLLRFFPDYSAFGLQPSNSVQEISKNFQNTILERIFYFIDKGFYLEVFMPENLIPGTQLFELSPVMHNSLFFGYDKQKQIFKILNFNRNMDYIVIELAFSDLVHAFEPDNIYPAIDGTPWFKNLVGGYNNFINLFRINPERDRELGGAAGFIKHYLEDYLESHNTSLGCLLTDKYEEDACWGIDTYQPLYDYIQQIEGGSFDFGCLHLFYEHKKVMLMRFTFLEQCGILPKCGQAFSEIFRPTVEKAYKFWLNCLKYFVSKKESLKEGLLKAIPLIKAEELRVYAAVLEVLDKKGI